MAKILDETRALVLFSGGQDSTVCLGFALSRYKEVYTFGCNYGQRHDHELVARKEVLRFVDRLPWSGMLREDVVVDMRFFSTLTKSALTSGQAIVMGDDGLPSTFVPGRNLFFLTAAAAYAYANNIGVIIGGMGEADYSGYPDCRKRTIDALNVAINRGMDAEFQLLCPLMDRDKESIWRLAEELGRPHFFPIVRWQTHTCYRNEHTLEHTWGKGCGECPACILRKNGFHKYQESQKEQKGSQEV